MSRAWYKDQAVTVVELPQPVCQHLLDCLIKNTSSMPSSLQHAANDFIVCCAVFYSYTTVGHKKVPTKVWWDV